MKCKNCTRPAKPNRKYCEHCIASAYNSKKRQNAKLISEGLCITCRKPAEKMRCQICALKCNLRKQFKSTEKLEQLLELFDHQVGVCGYTGLPLVIGINASIDHKQPRSKGGTDELQNLHWVDTRVNMMKGDMTHQEFIDFLKVLSVNLTCVLSDS